MYKNKYYKINNKIVKNILYQFINFILKKA